MCIFQFFSIYDILKQSLEYTNILELQTKLCDILSPSIVDLCEIEIMAVRSSWLNSAASEKILNMNTGFYRFFFLLTYTISCCLSAFGFHSSLISPCVTIFAGVLSVLFPFSSLWLGELESFTTCQRFSSKTH